MHAGGYALRGLRRDAEIAGVQSFRCPQLRRAGSDLRQGRELEIESIEIEEPEDGTAS